jgi:cell wall-associated NlpC family hydrolase
MSIEAVVGRVDQIMAMQQQMADPASALQSSTGGAAVSAPATGTATSGTSPASFSDALNSAMASSAIGTDPTAAASDPTAALTPMLATATPTSLATATPTGLATATPTGLATATPTSLGTATPTGLAAATPTLATGMATTSGSAPAQVQAMTNMANSLVGLPYVYGGGHGSWAPQPGYDCSGFVSAVLHAGGYLSQPADTTTLPQQPGIEPGPGQYVTVYDRAQPGQTGHVIIEINGQFYESGGSQGAWGGGGGVEKIDPPPASYLATFPNVLHPAGL